MTRPTGTGIAQAAVVRQVSIDELSDVRHLHAISMRKLCAAQLSTAEIDAFAHHIYSDAYSLRLAETVRAGRLWCAVLPGNSDLLATAGWVPANDSGDVVRLIGVFVHPLYDNQGFGRLMVATCERLAKAAGFASFAVRCPVGAVGFFVTQGFEIASYGVWPMGGHENVPVAFLRK